ncbi:uncharacterized protein N7483_008577 [Penicillium malachiteum]|uniref:uncharacterized protein n=1 Tax=Penicillium malachiteum TaxID=1324776 RepID=UPI002549154E|nr:uncharacterized protein N7483_008577 [Penicillium malachiteum]KAJ5720643.1 hypothetical protein N7483_008577 [Penicillium malachiteum]
MSVAQHLLMQNLAHEAEGFLDPHMAGQIQAIGTGRFQYAKLPEFIKAKPRPCNVFGAGILNSLISEYLQSSSVLLNTSAISDPILDQTRSESIQSMLIWAFDLIHQIDTWENSIPPHWQKQYCKQNTPGVVSILADPWTTTFLAVTHSAQILFYQNVIALCDELTMREPAMGSFTDNHQHIKLRKTAADRIKAPLEVVCFAVTSSIGELDTDGQFYAKPTVQLANHRSQTADIYGCIPRPPKP